MLKLPSENPTVITVGMLMEKLSKLPKNAIVMIPEGVPNTHCVNAVEVEEDVFVTSKGSEIIANIM